MNPVGLDQHGESGIAKARRAFARSENHEVAIGMNPYPASELRVRVANHFRNEESIVKRLDLQRSTRRVTIAAVFQVMTLGARGLSSWNLDLPVDSHSGPLPEVLRESSVITPFRAKLSRAGFWPALEDCQVPAMLNRQPSDGSWPTNAIGKTRNREKIIDIAKDKPLHGKSL